MEKNFFVLFSGGCFKMSQLPIFYASGGKTPEQLRAMYEQMRPSEDEVKVEYKNEEGNLESTYLHMSKGLSHSMSFWAGARLPPLPETFVIGGIADITDSCGKPEAPPSGQLEDTIDETASIHNIFH